MEIIKLDSAICDAFVFPGCDKPVGVNCDPDDNRMLMTPNELLLDTPIRAVITDTARAEMTTREEKMAMAWNTHRCAIANADSAHSLEDVIASWNLLGMLAVEVTCAASYGGSANRVYYILNAAHWREVTLLIDVA